MEKEQTNQEIKFLELISMLRADLNYGLDSTYSCALILYASENKEKYLNLLNSLMSNPIVLIKQYSGVLIDENGDVLEEGYEPEDAFKILKGKIMRIKTWEDLMSIKSWPNVYIYGIGLHGNKINLEFSVINNVKKKITITVDTDIHENFVKMSNKMAINKSKFVENKMKEFMKEMELLEYAKNNPIRSDVFLKSCAED